MSTFAVILVAAGKSTRFDDKAYKKPYANLAGRAVWLHSAERLLDRQDVEQLIVVIAEEDQEDFNRRFGANRAIMGFDLCCGGAQRSDSVKAGLARVKPGIEWVAVHDAARPCVTDKALDAVFAKARETNAALLASPVASTLKRATKQGGLLQVEQTVARENLWAAQTPQAFRRDLLERAYAQADAPATDDAQLVERLGVPVVIVPDTPLNLKITTKSDLRLAEQILKNRPVSKAKGLHPFADDLWR